MALLVTAAPVLLPEYRDEDAARLDLTSVVLSLGALLPAVYAIKDGAAHGLGWPTLALAVVSVGLGTTFLRRQRHLQDPMLDVALFSDRTFTISVVTHGGTLLVLAGVQYLVAQHLQLSLGLTPLQAGLWTLPAALGGLAGALAAAVLVRASTPLVVITGGLFAASAGFVALTRVPDGLAVLVPALAVASLAVGLVTALTTDQIVGAAPPERAGAASGISETTAELGIALGVATLGSLATAVYRANLGAVPDPAAQESLGRAVSTAQRIGGEQGARLFDAARAAFTDGLQASAGIAAILVAVLTVYLARPPARLRRGMSLSGGRVELSSARQRDRHVVLRRFHRYPRWSTPSAACPGSDSTGRRVTG